MQNQKTLDFETYGSDYRMLDGRYSVIHGRATPWVHYMMFGNYLYWDYDNSVKTTLDGVVGINSPLSGPNVILKEVYFDNEENLNKALMSL